VLDPSARLLRLDARVVEIRRAFGAGEPIATLGESGDPASVLVWRRDERVQLRVVASEEAELLARLRGGITFSALCERVAARGGVETAPANAAGWLAGWRDTGLLRR